MWQVTLRCIATRDGQCIYFPKVSKVEVSPMVICPQPQAQWVLRQQWLMLAGLSARSESKRTRCTARHLLVIVTFYERGNDSLAAVCPLWLHEVLQPYIDITGCSNLLCLRLSALPQSTQISCVVLAPSHSFVSLLTVWRICFTRSPCTHSIITRCSVRSRQLTSFRVAWTSPHIYGYL